MDSDDYVVDYDSNVGNIYEDQITCPYCHEIYTHASFEYREEDVLQCEKCAKIFCYTRDVTIQYNSYAVKKRE